MDNKAKYLWRQILNHVSLFYLDGIREAIEKNNRIIFVSYNQALQTRDKVIAIPIDIPASIVPQEPYKVNFNDTQLTLWNRLPRPNDDKWKALPDETNPLWYQHRSGALIPAWNVFGNLFNLLTFREEREVIKKDKHDRFIAEFSPRLALGLLEVPAFNEAVAAMVDACLGLRQNGSPNFYLDKSVKPPVIILSHDCDILLGNDRWTQLVKASRTILPLFKARLPKVSNLWWIAHNALLPKRFYFDNVTGMIDLERNFGYTSTYYLLNGTGGRYGARNGSGVLPELVKEIPSNWDIGIHYNYDTYLDHERFHAQIEELSKILPNEIEVGRAHYLRFNSDQSLSFLHSFGISCDESAGYPDRIGFRCGIGGCFQAYNDSSSDSSRIWEVPLAIMDSTLSNQYGEDSRKVFHRILYHMSRVGGAISLLYHPGVFFNPEFPKMLGEYHNLLKECRKLGARSMTALSLIKTIAN